MAGIFARIAAGEIPSYRVAEDSDHFAFLDINPVNRGHVLVIPKKETDYIFDLDTEEYASLWKFARRVARGLRRAVPCTKVGVTVIGLDVPHAHIHLVPMDKGDDMNFCGPKLKLPDEEMRILADKIAAEVAREGED